MFKAATLVMLFGLSLGCSGAAVPEPELLRPVKTMVVTAGEDTQVRSFPGTVEASRRVELAFRVPGLLAELPVIEGQRVAKGDLIARLRQDEFQARLKSLRGELDQARAALVALRAGERPEEILRRESQVRAAKARLANARAEHERNTRLLAGNTIPRSVFDQSEALYRVAEEEHTAAQKLLGQATTGREEDIEAKEAQIRGLEGRVVEAQIQLDDSTVLAPYDGVIARRFVDKGQNIRASDPVVQFQDVDEVDVAVDVPETVMAADIQLAEIVQMTAELSAAPGVTFPVRIREVAQVADPVTQTFNVRVAMQSPAGIRVLPGMSATVSLTYRRAAVLGSRLFIPLTAVAKTPSGDQVAWILDDSSVVVPRAVTLGAAVGSQVEVTGGLQPGDRIVVAGVPFLREGLRVRDLGDALGGGTP